jgi:predicted metal-dependent HD superfamily phosphohydrolase
MDTTGVPGWLEAVWTRVALETGATAGTAEIEHMGHQLLERWCNPVRRFHGLHHLTDVLTCIDELAEEAARPAPVRMAAFYHGVILALDSGDPHTGGEDEALSADLAQTQLAHLGVPQPTVARIHALIAGMGVRPAVIKDPDLAVLCDAERSVLASDPQRYKAYGLALRQEFAHQPLAQVLESRRRVLQGWLAKDRLFLTSTGVAWEDTAHHNVEAELARLTKELDVLHAGSVAA